MNTQNEKKRCPHCLNSKVKCNGLSRHGNQRWRCLICGRTFGWTNKKNKHLRQQVWFRKWIVEGYTFKQLSTQSGKSPSTIQRIVHYWLHRTPKMSLDFSSYQYLILDGTYFKQQRGLYAVMNAANSAVFHSLTDVSERRKDLKPFFSVLADSRLAPKSATVDGNSHVISVLRTIWPFISIQRCLVHVQRQGLMWCRHQPKRTDAKHLRELFGTVMYIRNNSQRDSFIQDVKHWEKRYGELIASSAESGWVFSDLKRARSMLLAALPDMFHYLNDSNIPRTTNALEGYFARLKHKYRQHHGMTKHHQINYFKWYLDLCPR
jgi:transposase-like protein